MSACSCVVLRAGRACCARDAHCAPLQVDEWPCCGVADDNVARHASPDRPPLGPGSLATYEYELGALADTGLDEVAIDAALTATRIGGAAGAHHQGSYSAEYAYALGLARVLDGLEALVQTKKR